MELKLFNEKLKEIDRRLHLVCGLKNCCRKKIEECDRKHPPIFSINVWDYKGQSIVAKSAFNLLKFENVNLRINEVGRFIELGITREKILSIEKLLVSSSMQKQHLNK